MSDEKNAMSTGLWAQVGGWSIMTLITLSFQNPYVTVTPFRCFLWCIAAVWAWIIVKQIKKPWRLLVFCQQKQVWWVILALIVLGFLLLGIRSSGRQKSPGTPSQSPVTARNVQYNTGDRATNIMDSNVTINPPAQSKSSWLLVPADEPDPFNILSELPPELVAKQDKHDFPPDALKVFLGHNVGYIRTMGLHRILEIGGEEIIAINRTPKGLFISANIWREDGRELAIIRDNQFVLNRNNYYVRFPEMPSPHELQVFGKSGDLLWKVRYVNEQAVVFQGTFHAPNHTPVIVTEDKILSGKDPFWGNLFTEPKDPRGHMFSIR